MTIQAVIEMLAPIYKSVKRLLWHTDFDPAYGLGEYINHLPDDYEDAFLRNEVGEILECLDYFCNRFYYLNQPVSRVYRVEELDDGSCGYFDESYEFHEFCPGDKFEAIVMDKSGMFRWAPVQIEENKDGFYLPGFSDTPVPGLLVRERGW